MIYENAVKPRRTAYEYHGESNTALYRVWAGILRRTLDPKFKKYSYYGGRGITIAKEFLSYVAFRDCLLMEAGKHPGKGYSLDRIDNDKGYEPGNLRWATKSEQNNNTSRKRIAFINGEELPLAIAVKKYGKANYNTTKRRLNAGWSLDKALSTPPRTYLVSN